MRAPAAIRIPPGTIGRNRPIIPPSTRLQPKAKIATRLRGPFNMAALLSEAHAVEPEYGFVWSVAFVIGSPNPCTTDSSSISASSDRPYLSGGTATVLVGRRRSFCFSLAQGMSDSPIARSLRTSLRLSHQRVPNPFEVVGTFAGPSRSRRTCRPFAPCLPSGLQSL
jgi:hypothetical protein